MNTIPAADQWCSLAGPPLAPSALPTNATTRLRSCGRRSVAPRPLILGAPDRDQLYAALSAAENRLGRPVQATVREAGWLNSGSGSFHSHAVQPDRSNYAAQRQLPKQEDPHSPLLTSEARDGLGSHGRAVRSIADRGAGTAQLGL